ncbi:MFS transporter [Brevundimonas subvibrioides]|uniref:MFS transporter n=1 Tax=Brevundimonas subvibrioides TaxID=74313 RepID=UPI0022B59890|nr:MFS transporter [Brevundimonas subvibrioides]
MRDAAVPAPVRPAFVMGYTLAQIGAYVAFVPLLNIVLPIQADTLSPGNGSLVLSQVAILGALAAGATNFIAGTVSDRAEGPLRGRRPWIVGGALATSAACLAIVAVPTSGALVLAVVLFQIALNIMFGPLNAVLADRVPDVQKGMVSAMIGLGFPVATLFAALVIAVLLRDQTLRMLVVAATVITLVVPFGLGLKEPTRQAAPLGLRRLSFYALRDRDFLMAFVSRLLVQVAITLNVLYLLFFLQQETDIGRRFPDLRAEAILGWLMAAATMASLVVGFAGGFLSDRFRRRKAFVASGALMMGGGALLLIAMPQWPGPLVAQLLFGAGLGLYSTVDVALVAEVLPSRENAGRDLGIMNLAITLPQFAAPLLGMLLISMAAQAMTWIFASAAVFALAGALAVARISKVM